MPRLGPIFRLLVLTACLVPFTGPQPAPGALVSLPDAPTNEDEEGREEADGKERHAPQTRPAVPAREAVAAPPPAHGPHRLHVTKPRTTPPVAADPFRNGLGTPYRC